MNKVLVCLLFLYFLSGQCKGQDSCTTVGIYKTDSAGDESEKLAFPLYFSVTIDSIIIYLQTERTIPFLSFKILTKNCNWEKYFLKGITTYKVLLLEDDGIEKHPTLNIVFTNPAQRFIEILYENSEKRIFTISSDCKTARRKDLSN